MGDMQRYAGVSVTSALAGVCPAAASLATSSLAAAGSLDGARR